MFFERYNRRRRWIVGCVIVSIAVIIMLLAPPPRVRLGLAWIYSTDIVIQRQAKLKEKKRHFGANMTPLSRRKENFKVCGKVNLFWSENVYETRRSNEETFGSKNATDTRGSKEISFPIFKPFTTSTSALPSQSMFSYVEEPPTWNEMKRLMRALSTQGAICSDVRRIGGLPQGPHGAPRPLGPDGMWYVCFDEEVELLPGRCVVYSFGTGDDFSFDEKMANHGCTVFAFDPSMGKEDHNHSAGVMFYNLGLSNQNQEGVKNALPSDPLDKSTWKTRTLAAIIQELGHAKREIDILKMDIESDEWKCLRHMLAEGTLRKFIRQLDVEYHVIINTPEALRQYYSIAKWLERQGFRIFHSRRNPYCLECWEMSYINSNLVNLPLN